MDFSHGQEVPSDDVATTSSSTKSVHAPRFDVQTDARRDELLTEFGKETLRDRYLLPGESYQDLFARVAAAYADDDEHAHIDPNELRDADDAPTNGVDLLLREFGGGELVEEEQ